MFKNPDTDSKLSIGYFRSESVSLSKILPVILAVSGLGAGIGAGVLLRPDPVATVEMNRCGDAAEGDHASQSEPDLSEVHENTSADFVKLNNQFVVPVVYQGDIVSLVVLSLTLEVTAGGQDQVYQREPKLRDVFLQVLFDHANAGGFDGAFTSGQNMSLLREALLESAQKTFGPAITDVLIVDLVRQDV